MTKITPFPLVNSSVILLIRIFFAALFFFKRPNLTPNLKKTLDLYKKRGFMKLFTLIRVWDSPYEELEKIIPKKETILDLGCGDGFFTNYLALSEDKRKMIGVEINTLRVKEASNGVENANFIKGDILNYKIPRCEAVLLVHVLHHLPSHLHQEKILQSVFNHLRKNGKLIIVEIVKRPFLKYLLTYLVDVIVVPILFEHKLFTVQIFYRDTREWESLLTKIGFKTASIPASVGKPFSHAIFIAEKI